MDSERARAGVDVVAGLLPGTPMPEFTKQWFLTEREWSQADGSEKSRAMFAEAAKYAADLMHNAPNSVNWVRVDWVWF